MKMNKVVKKAISQIGYCESPAGSNRTKYGREFGLNGEAWCAIFLWWCFKHSGKGSLFPHNANAAYAQDEIVSKCGGKWVMKKNTSRSARKAYLGKAKPGDIVCFDFGRFNAYRQHIGIVEKVSGNNIICIEGNTSKSGSQSNGGMVCRKYRLYSEICSAARPKWVTKTKIDGSWPERGYFKEGDYGDAVKVIQKRINKAIKGSRGYTVKEDGEFGEKTKRAVKFLQEVRHLDIDGHYGKTTDAEAKKKVEPRHRAVNWAISIAKDNSFAYGTGKRAHNYGCYFCGTNRTGKKHAKKGSRWEKTYCCNPFIHAAYAHGAGNKNMLKACKAGGGGGMTPHSWTRYGCFKTVGKCKEVPYKSLRAGDVIISAHSPNHVWMYVGRGHLVEASGEGWGANTIAHKGGAKKKYNSKYKNNSTAYVMRYKG